MHSLKAFPFQVQVGKEKTTADFQRRARRIIKMLDSKVEKHIQLSKQQCPDIPFLHNTFVQKYIFLAIAAFLCVFTEQ